MNGGYEDQNIQCCEMISPLFHQPNVLGLVKTHENQPLQFLGQKNLERKRWENNYCSTVQLENEDA
jgi:hypothetical protein